MRERADAPGQAGGGAEVRGSGADSRDRLGWGGRLVERLRGLSGSPRRIRVDHRDRRRVCGLPFGHDCGVPLLRFGGANSRRRRVRRRRVRGSPRLGRQPTAASTQTEPTSGAISRARTAPLPFSPSSSARGRAPTPSTKTGPSTNWTSSERTRDGGVVCWEPGGAVRTGSWVSELSEGYHPTEDATSVTGGFDRCG